MKRYTPMLMAIMIILSFFTGCGTNLYSARETGGSSVSTGTGQEQSAPSPAAGSQSAANSTAASSTGTEGAEAAQTPGTPVETINYDKVKPNEAGQIMVVMFHNFVEAYPKGNNEYTTTFQEFEKLLGDLYEKKYRLVSLTDMINNNIDVPAGCIPMVFTFDDGTGGQLSLIEQDGKLTANPKSAVGIMEAFNRQHPDFGLKGTFYVNLGLKTTFKGAGTLADRLNYLIEKGFEIGNHTKDHVSLPKIKTVQEMLEQVGGNQALMNEIVPGYTFNSFSLPFGNASKDLKEYVIKGNYQGTEYRHLAIVHVGSGPVVSPVSPKFDPLAMPRVRSTGQKKVECDLDWWLEELGKGSSQYVSDGNPGTVTVPKAKQQYVDMSKLNGKQLITY